MKVMNIMMIVAAVVVIIIVLSFLSNNSEVGGKINSTRFLFVLNSSYQQ